MPLRSKPYLWAMTAVVAAVALRVALTPVLGGRLPYTVMILAVAVIARYAGVGPALLALVTGAAGVNWFVVPGDFFPPSADTRASLFGYAMVSVVMIYMFGTMRRDAERVEVQRRQLIETMTARERSDQALRGMADSMPQIVYVTDADGHVVYLNRRWREYCGLQTIHGVETVVHPDDLGALQAEWARALREGTPLECEIRMRRAADGQYRWFLTRAHPARDEAGVVTQWFGTSTDIHDQKETEAERRRGEEQLRLALEHAESSRGQLQEADRRKDEFLAVLSHELRNPLAPMRTALHLMKVARDDAPLMMRARDIMERQLGQMVRLIDDLLDISRVSRGKLELRRGRVSLSHVLHQAMEAAAPAIGAGSHRLEADIPDDVMLDADEVRLVQVFANLLDNAAKYSEPGGRIQVEAVATSSQVQVAVRDTGVGIPPDMLPRIFDMFTQVDRALARGRGGLGIGLSLVRRLVEMHGGTVVAESDGVGQGSEFRVTLPRPAAELVAAAAPVITRRRVASTPRRVLIADDNDDVLESLALLVRAMGHEVHTASDGAAAVQVARQVRPDIVLLDLGMPVMTGFDACRELKAEAWAAAVPIVALTGWGQEHDRQRSREAGFDDHIVKPVSPDRLEQLLEVAGERPPSCSF